MKFHTQFPDGSLPVGIYGCFGGQQILEGFVGICPKFHCITGGVMLPALEAAAIGVMLVGIPSREASATLALT